MKKRMKRFLTTTAAIIMCAGMAVSAQAAWKQSGQCWYYELGNGHKAVGWHNIDATWYYFDANGEMMTGWILIGGEWYYMRSSGAMVSDQWIGNYYLGASGAMAKNAWIGPYYVGADGAWIPNYTGDSQSSQDQEPEEVYLKNMKPVSGRAVHTTQRDAFGNLYYDALGVSREGSDSCPIYYTNGKYSEFRVTLAPMQRLEQTVEFCVQDGKGNTLDSVDVDALTEPFEFVVDIEGEKYVELCKNYESIYRTYGLIVADARFVE